MKNLKDPKPKIFPSSTRGGKKLPSSSALDSPSVMSKLATPPHAINNPQVQGIIVAIPNGGSDKYGVSNPQGAKCKINILSSPIFR